MSSPVVANNSALVELFGSSLVEMKDKKVEKVETVSKFGADSNVKAVGIYFSAHWCGPCRSFTPKLCEWYTKDLKNKGLEIVFASSDRDEAAFNDYFQEMPFLALPYAERELKNKLSKKFKVRGIPSFVIVDAETGNVITLDGRSAVSQDPTGEDFEKTKWAPPALKDIIGDEYHAKNDEEGKKDEFKSVSLKNDVLANKDLEAIGIYFSAHWCPPCRSFTPKLVDVYNKLNAGGKKRFEVIFCSADRDEKAFKDYFDTHPWLALPYSDKKREGKLSQHFDVSGIPCLVILDPKDLSVINASAVGKVHGDAEGKNFPWTPDTVKALDEDPEGIDEGLSLIMLQEEVGKEEQEKNVSVLKEVHGKYKNKLVTNKDNEEAQLLYFKADEAGRLADRVRDACSVSAKKNESKIVMMNIPENLYYDFEYTEVTVDNVSKFFESYKAGTLSTKPMSG